MAKKTFSIQGRVVRSDRWRIDFTITNRTTGEAARHRKEFNLNDIEDVQVREQVAQRLLDALPDLLIEIPGVPAARIAHLPAKQETVAEALALMVSEKSAAKRKDSRKNYKAVGRHLLEWMRDRHYADLPAAEFTRKHAKAFKAYLLAQERFAGKTINNYITSLVTMWNGLSEYGIRVENPWAKMKKERVEKKKRRTYTLEEKRIVVAEIETHYWLYRAMLLLYYCGIRRTEMCRIKFGDFDFKSGVITVDAEAAKTYKERSPTIPDVILPAFLDGRFNKFPKNFYVFGREWEPNAAHPLNPDRISKAHRAILDALIRRGALKKDAIIGLDFYAWKDTAISRHIRITSPIATRDQVGHAELSQTLVYYHAPKVNEEYRDLPDTLHE